MDAVPIQGSLARPLTHHRTPPYSKRVVPALHEHDTLCDRPEEQTLRRHLSLNCLSKSSLLARMPAYLVCTFPQLPGSPSQLDCISTKRNTRIYLPNSYRIYCGPKLYWMRLAHIHPHVRVKTRNRKLGPVGAHVRHSCRAMDFHRL